jgi:hypothetical protein
MQTLEQEVQAAQRLKLGRLLAAGGEGCDIRIGAR